MKNFVLVSIISCFVSGCPSKGEVAVESSATAAVLVDAPSAEVVASAVAVPSASAVASAVAVPSATSVIVVPTKK